MGGLISLYAICEYPEVFGGAGCVSTHWPAVEGVIAPYLVENLPDPATHRLYFDYGTDTLDALYQPTQFLVDEVVAGAGYTRDVNWVTRKFPGAAHDERSWAQRVSIPLRFLLGAGRMEP
jgi:pimeloyl-ACP methyl ester carboxylesterase